jgi:site-specific recombinase XerD
MSIQRFHQLINKWTSAIGLKDGNYGTHTLRKTFAYFLLKKGSDIMILMDLLNHSSPAVTLRYAGITQEDRDKTILRLNL